MFRSLELLSTSAIFKKKKRLYFDEKVKGREEKYFSFHRFNFPFTSLLRHQEPFKLRVIDATGIFKCKGNIVRVLRIFLSPRGRQ